MRERERKRERREKKNNIFPDISQGFAGRNSIGQELKLLYMTRVMRGYLNHKISPRFKFRRNREKAMSREITQIEVGFLSYSV